MRALVSLIALAAVAGCATYTENADWRADARHAAAIQTDPESCSRQLVGSTRSQRGELDSRDIRIVNWNIQKGRDPQWTADLATFMGEADVMIFQEASLNTAAWDIIASNHYRSFAPGHRTSRTVTGVITLSATEPLTQCNLVSIEPWLRTPKATMITEYGLTDTDQTLLVVNIHAINFTLGTMDFQEQIGRALSVIDEHVGPILLSGDFNTWHRRRSKILHEMAASVGLTTLDYDEDHRKRAFGQPLDHVYVRGLHVIEATTTRVRSSDHNPMSVRLRLWSSALPSQGSSDESH